VLDEAHIPAADFKALYHLRWGIEEDYKQMKSHLEVEQQFSGLSVLAVRNRSFQGVLPHRVFPR
jgi:IS4 transposase